MKFDEVLPIENLFSRKPGAATTDTWPIEPDADAAMAAGIDLILEQEQLSRDGLETFFRNLQARTEQKIQHGHSTTDHLTVLNRQLRMAAAVFLLITCSSFAIANNLAAGSSNSWNGHDGPYELADGKKIVP